jgi:signal transduction histidine kinase
MTLVPRSLEARLIGVSLLWIVLALGVAAYVLSGLFQNHVVGEHAERIGGYLEELAAALDVNSDGALVLQRDLSDPLFRRPYSGLYWEVFVDGRTVLRSRSLWDQSIGTGQAKVESGGPLSVPGPDRQSLSAWTKTILHPHHPRPITMLVAADRSRVESMASSFTRTLAVSLAILALGLAAVVVAQVQIGLAPLRRLGRTITELREGHVDRVEGDFPSEVRPLVEDLNAVLNDNRELLARARAQAGNLAHALKTPLAVIRNSLTSIGSSPSSATISAEVERMHQAIERHLVRARAGSVQQHGRRVLVRAALEDVVRAIGRMHGDKVRIELVGDVAARFRGDASDLQEILGNLLDNAAKWARSHVRVDLRTTEGRIEITIEDDGPGIPLQRRTEAIQRGVRLDTSRPGSGLGLQIVDELCRIYEGSLELGDSTLGGLAARVILPGQ